MAIGKLFLMAAFAFGLLFNMASASFENVVVINNDYYYIVDDAASMESFDNTVLAFFNQHFMASRMARGLI